MSDRLAKPKVDAPFNPDAADKTNWEYVAFPEEDVLGQPAPVFTLNREEYHPGQTYLVDPIRATELKNRIREWHKSRVRILQPTADIKTSSQLGRPNVAINEV